MWTRTTKVAALLWLTAPGIGQAQDPLSAVGWLTESLHMPLVVPDAALGMQDQIAVNALPEDVTTSALGQATPDGTGLIPASVSGLPRNLWGSSASSDLARRFLADRGEQYPAIQNLFYTLLLAELDPPQDSGPSPTLFLARIEALLKLGAVDQADALLQRAGTQTPRIFARRFDTSLLLGNEDVTCATMLDKPDLAPDMASRIFCLARSGDWDTAAVTLENARALGQVTASDADLLGRFLDPSASEDTVAMVPPTRPSALVFRLFEAVGEPISTTGLPLAFAVTDLADSAGWKAQIEAAERLARTGAIDPNHLLGLYTARKPAASGGVWNRATAVQALDDALGRNDPAAVASALPAAWDAMTGAELEVPFAQIFATRLAQLDLPGDAATLALHIGLLADGYENTAAAAKPQSQGDFFLQSVARGLPAPAPSRDKFAAAVSEAFQANGIPVRLQSLVSEGRLGEAILRAIDLFDDGANGNLDELRDALAFFRAAGLEDTARRAALQILLLERRG